MQKETTYRNHYKTNPSLKDTLIFFRTAWYYKTFESDARLVAQLFWFKISLQEWLETTWFLETSKTYLDRLADAWYSYIILELHKDWNISILQRNIGTKSLEITVPLETFQSLLNDIYHICERYNTSLRLIQPIDMPFNENPKFEIKELFLPDIEENEN